MEISDRFRPSVDIETNVTADRARVSKSVFQIWGHLQKWVYPIAYSKGIEGYLTLSHNAKNKLDWLEDFFFWENIFPKFAKKQKGVAVENKL